MLRGPHWQLLPNESQEIAEKAAEFVSSLPDSNAKKSAEVLQKFAAPMALISAIGGAVVSRIVLEQKHLEELKHQAEQLKQQQESRRKAEESKQAPSYVNGVNNNARSTGTTATSANTNKNSPNENTTDPLSVTSDGGTVSYVPVA